MTRNLLIIGGGVVGLTIARELQKRGITGIALVDRGTVGSEASWAAAGMLAPNIEAPKQNSFHSFCIESLKMYPGLADELRVETGIDIELDRSGTMYLAFGDEDERELELHAARGFQKLSPAEIRKLEPAITGLVSGGILFPDDWQVDNRKLLAALRESVVRRGIRILEDTQILRLQTDGLQITGARSTNGDLNSQITVLATGAWTSLIKIGDTGLPATIKPIRGQMLSFATTGRTIARVVFSPRGYLVPRRDGRVLVGATVEDVGFDKRTTDEGLDDLRSAAVEIVPDLGKSEITEHWAGLRPYAADGFPILGELPGYKNAFVATAHYRNGILLAPKTAEIMADLITKASRSEYLDPFAVTRFGSAANANASS